jgi:hypothetical protein
VISLPEGGLSIVLEAAVTLAGQFSFGREEEKRFLREFLK